PAERAEELRRFTNGGAPVLLATDAASEGLNLHHRCRLVVNLEVPWTPLRFEQRVVRVDRLGQRARVHALTAVARNTIEESVIARFSERLERVTDPLSPTSQPAGAGVARLDLRHEGRHEVERLQLVRSLAMRSARGAVAVRSDSSRAVAGALRGCGDPAIYWAIRLLFVDAAGHVEWDTVVAATTLSAPQRPFHRAADLRAWLERVHQHLALPLAASAARAHDRECARVATEIARACERLAARDRAIVRMLRDRDGRLARPLVQAALFDRRALRDAEAQRRLSDLAIERATVRFNAVQRLLSVRPGDRHLLFTLVRTR